MCQIVGVSRSSFYAWVEAADGRAARAAADAQLEERIRAVHAEQPEQPGLRGTAGDRRAQRRRPARAAGEPQAGRPCHGRATASPGSGCAAGSAPRSPSRPTSRWLTCWNRNFTAPGTPTSLYVGDITYLPCGEGPEPVPATVIDCFSRRLVGWSIADHMRTELVADALTAAAAIRVGPGGLAGAIFHSRPRGRAVHVSGLRRAVRPASGCAARWARSGRARTTRWPSRSTPPSSARSLAGAAGWGSPGPGTP